MIKQISDWKHILLDTSVIIDYLMIPERISNNENAKTRVEKTHLLFDYFRSTIHDLKRTLYISAITLSELRKLSNDASILETLMNLFNCSDIVFVDYTKEMAMQIHAHVDLIGKDPNLNSFVKNLGTELNKDGVYQASGWVADDLKIVATAKFFKGKIDVVITGDRKTFIPLAERFEIPVVNTFKLPLTMFKELDVNFPIN
jgi:hypothetical protein